jgi:hypothetical protein
MQNCCARYLTPYEMQISLAPVSGFETVGLLAQLSLGSVERLLFYSWLLTASNLWS